MRKYLKIGSKVGYLKARTGKYEWNRVVNINEHSVQLERKTQGQTYRFWEITRDVLDYAKIFSKDYVNKTLIKF